jgi:hypothetical protein
MQSKIPEDVPNVIKSILDSMEISLHPSQITGDPIKNQRIWLIYNMASTDVKAILDLLMIEICKKPLRELLGYTGETRGPGDIAKSALEPTLQIMIEMVRNRVVGD